MIEYFNALILGIVEGLTEFLPVSSTGHLILVGEFFKLKPGFQDLFNIVIQLGAILAVVILFWKRLFPWAERKGSEERARIWKLWKLTIIGVLPALLAGALLASKIKEYLFGPIPVASALIFYGVMILLIDGRKRKIKFETVNDFTWQLALLIGAIQCLALWPGTSRSGVTIIGALLLGVSRVAAAEFSFFLAAPTLLAASVYELAKSIIPSTKVSAAPVYHLVGEDWMILALGILVSFLVAWGVIKVFMTWVSKHDFKPFGWYRIVLGLGVLAYFLWPK